MEASEKRLRQRIWKTIVAAQHADVFEGSNFEPEQLIDGLIHFIYEENWLPPEREDHNEHMERRDLINECRVRSLECAKLLNIANRLALNTPHTFREKVAEYLCEPGRVVAGKTLAEGLCDFLEEQHVLLIAARPLLEGDYEDGDIDE